MITLLLGPALAGPLAQQAQQRTEAYGPFVAVYLKASTQEPALEIHLQGTRDATVRSTTPDGVFEASVDATHARLKLQGTCASVEAARLLTEVNQLGLQSNDIVPTPRLVYRPTPDGQVELAAAFHGIPSNVLFSWHADLDGEGVEVTTTKKSWTGRSPLFTWTVSRKTGLLERMSVGDDALVLDKVLHGKKAQPSSAVAVCPETTNTQLKHELATQLRLSALPSAFATAVGSWGSLDAAARQQAVALYTAWWADFCADELPVWSKNMAQAPWRQDVLTRMTDAQAFDDFTKRLPEDQRDQAVERWKHAWFEQVAQDMLAAHLRELAGAATRKLKSPLDPSIEQALLVGPLRDALLNQAEGLLQPFLVPVVEEAGAVLQTRR